jgi:predicted transcriptional regulator of viral defense system
MNRLTEQFFHSPTGVFTQAEVAVALNGSAFSRHGLVKRALADGEILNIRRGLYCLAPRYQKRSINVFELAQHIYGPSYISLETALSYHGWIPEGVHACTCASFGNAKEFSTPLGVFSYRRIPQNTFYTGVARCVDQDGNAYFMASPGKALADYVYVHKPDWGGIDEASASLRLEADDWSTTNPDHLDMLMNNYNHRRVRRFLASWKERLRQ